MTNNVAVSLTPLRGGLTVTQKLSLTPTVTGDSSNAGVAWSFTSTGSTSGGSFSSTSSASGTPVTFSAPTGAGVVTIRATSVADSTKSASAAIGVSDLPGVFTYHNDNARTGANTQEYALTTATVSTATFGKLFSCNVDAAIYAQPLWVANLSFSGTKHNAAYVATEHDTMYAFDADSPSCTDLWGGAKSLLGANETWVDAINDAGCGDLQPDIGITGTPVIDPATNTLYVVSKSKNPTTAPATFHQRLHALDLTTGAEKAGSPFEIQAQANGNGGGGTSGVIDFDPLINGQRAALLLSSDANGKHVIITWASHCDIGQYHGWVMSYSSSTLAQEAVLNVSPNGVLARIWMAGGGPAADLGGNVYLATGNGSFDSTNGNYGDAILRLSPPSTGTFPVASFFAPLDQLTLQDVDADLGSGGLVLLPDLPAGPHPQLLAQADKEGRIWIADRNSLGGFSSTSNSVVQELDNALPGGVWGSPAYWNGHIYFGAALDQGANSQPSDPLRDFTFDTTTGIVSLGTTSAKIFSFPGPTPSVSSNGTNAGIVWALDNQPWAQSCPNAACQVAYAYDATNLGNKLWDSSLAANNRDLSGGAVKFTVPTVANGRVYVGGQNTLTVYGLLPN